MRVEHAVHCACGQDWLGVFYLGSHLSWFLNFVPLAGFLQIGVEKATFMKVEFMAQQTSLKS